MRVKLGWSVQKFAAQETVNLKTRIGTLVAGQSVRHCEIFNRTPVKMSRALGTPLKCTHGYLWIHEPHTGVFQSALVCLFSKEVWGCFVSPLTLTKDPH